MNKPIRCTTHFHACDCREYEFEMVKKENEKLKKAIMVMHEALLPCASNEPFKLYLKGVVITNIHAKEALAKVDEILNKEIER